MATLFKLFRHLISKIIILLASLLIELIILIWKVTSDAQQRPITTREYLKFIEDKNPTVCYDTKRLLKLPEHGECMVCLSEFKEGDKVRSLKCKHTFHRDCLDKWLQEYWPTCPLCRKQLLPDDVVIKHRQLLRNQQEGGSEGNDENLPYLLFALRGGGANNTSHLRRYL